MVIASNNTDKFKIRKLKVGFAAVSLGLMLFASTPVSAVTISFDAAHPSDTVVHEDGFTLSPTRIVNGNCNVKPCLALNKNEFTDLTLDVPGTFTLTDFWFQLLGKANLDTLIVDFFNGATIFQSVSFSTATLNHNQAYLFSTFYTPVSNITKIHFGRTGGGNVRIDDIKLTVRTNGDPSPVPVPAALPMMVGGVGMFGWLSRRRKRTV